MSDHTVPCAEGDWPGCIPSCDADAALIDTDEDLLPEVDRLRAEVSVLEQVCRDQRDRVPAKTRDFDSGVYIGGRSCEHPNVATDTDRCRWCGATGEDL